MHDVLADVAGLFDSGARFGLATVVGTWRSAPRQPGAAMVVAANGEPIGSVSGGCVEAAVYNLARVVMETGEATLQPYGVSEDNAFAVGLTCGGTIDVFVEPIDDATFPELPAVVESVRAHEPVAVATVIGGPSNIGAHLAIWTDHFEGGLGSPRLNAAVVDDARGMLDAGVTGQLLIGRSGERRHDELSIFVESFAPPPRMLIFGAIDFARAVSRIGKFLGYRVTVCDARPVFATTARFPEADEVVVDWPHRYLASQQVDERTVVCVLTHDPKFDVPLLMVALETSAGYIGALGSRRTHETRLQQLRERGVQSDLERLASPIGLDIGARTPEETAVSIAAEILAVRRGHSGRRLKATPGRIHEESTV